MGEWKVEGENKRAATKKGEGKCCNCVASKCVCWKICVYEQPCPQWLQITLNYLYNNKKARYLTCHTKKSWSSMPNRSLRFRNTRGQYSLNLKWLGMFSLCINVNEKTQKNTVCDMLQNIKTKTNNSWMVYHCRDIKHCKHIICLKRSYLLKRWLSTLILE